VLERALTYRGEDRELLDQVGRVRTKALKRALAKAGKRGDHDDADRIEGQLRDHEVSELRRRITIHPGDAGLRLELGQALHRSGDHDGAAAELQKAVADPRRALEARITLARCFEAKGFGDLAAVEYQKALDSCPENDQRSREILYSLASLSEAAGDLDRARDLYTRIYEADVSFRDVARKMEQLR